MPLHYYLTDNLLNTDTNDYVAKSSNVRSYTLEEIIDRMAGKGMSLTKVDISAVLQAYHNEISNIIADGSAVNTPLFNAQPSISGTFNSMTDTYDPTRHKIKTNLTGGKVIKEAATKISFNKVPAPAQNTQITAVIDKTTNSTNDKLTKNAPIEITGNKIKITTEQGAGVFFIADSGAETQAAMIISNNPSSLIVMTPNLENGKYWVEIRTFYTSGGSPLKNIRTTRFSKLFTIE